MDTVAVDTGPFWQTDNWQREEDEADDIELQQGIRSWDGSSLSLRESRHAGSDEFSYSYNSYGYGTQDEWVPQLSIDTDPDALSSRRGEKRRADTFSGDVFEKPEVPDSPSMHALSSKARNPGTGSLFFKTKLCIKFNAGTCPYNSSCNFAHGMDELRKPPPGWEDMVGHQEMGAISSGSSVLPSSADSLRFRRARRCKKYYSEEGCPYGERCNFLHDDQAKARESNAISLGPSTNAGGGGIGNGNGGSERPSNWKTRMCNKWEMTGHCPFGQKCNFAHGIIELQTFAGAADGDVKTIQGSGAPSDSKTVAKVGSKAVVDGGSAYLSAVYVADSNNTPLRHRSLYTPYSKSQKQMKILTDWRGPADEISTIYGDWIEEDE